MSFTKYGIEWDDSIPDPFIELVCAKRWREEPYCNAKLDKPGDHMIRAIEMLFKPSEFTVSPWSRDHIHAWCEEDFINVWAGASCSKSNDFGLLATLDWITDPTETVSILASTTRAMLALRSYESVIRYFRILKQHPEFTIPGKESKTAMAIMNDDADDSVGVTTVKASIRGVAVQQGTVEEARANLQGAHLPYVRLILDEGEAIREAAYDARTNLSIGAYKSFKMIVLSNPESFTGMTARFAEPDTPDGWASVTVDSERWRSRYGLCLHHDGLKSPSITEKYGRTKYPYLLSQKDIDRVLAEEHGNMDAPRIWTMIRGWPPPGGLERTVLSEQDLITYSARDKAVWANEGEMVRLWGLDPAFTAEGDGCVLQTATLGRLKTGSAAIAFDDPCYLPIRASSDKPVIYQIVDMLRTELAERNVPVANGAIDDSGTQSVADVVERELGGGALRVNFASKASELNLTAQSADKGEDRFRDLVTDMWQALAEFVRYGQIRQLPEAAAKQVVRRRFRRIMASKLRGLETKGEYKKRTAMGSPDECDAAALCCHVARVRFGFLPGGAPGVVKSAIMQTGSQGLGMQGIFRNIRSKYLADSGLDRLRSYASR